MSLTDSIIWTFTWYRPNRSKWQYITVILYKAMQVIYIISIILFAALFICVALGFTREKNILVFEIYAIILILLSYIWLRYYCRYDAEKMHWRHLDIFPFGFKEHFDTYKGNVQTETIFHQDKEYLVSLIVSYGKSTEWFYGVLKERSKELEYKDNNGEFLPSMALIISIITLLWTQYANLTDLDEAFFIMILCFSISMVGIWTACVCLYAFSRVGNHMVVRWQIAYMTVILEDVVEYEEQSEGIKKQKTGKNFKKNTKATNENKGKDTKQIK